MLVAGSIVTSAACTKFGLTAATEAWRQEYTRRGVRFASVEPGATATELFDQQDGASEGYARMFADVELLNPNDIADAVEYIVTRPRRAAVNEILIRPTDQQA
ncbi:hypothetical protein [Cellulomonas sp. Marseille-Q8402]